MGTEFVDRHILKSYTVGMQQDSVMNQHQLQLAKLFIPIPESAPVTFKFSGLYNSITVGEYDCGR